MRPRSSSTAPLTSQRQQLTTRSVWTWKADQLATTTTTKRRVGRTQALRRAPAGTAGWRQAGTKASAGRIPVPLPWLAQGVASRSQMRTMRIVRIWLPLTESSRSWKREATSQRDILRPGQVALAAYPWLDGAIGARWALAAVWARLLALSGRYPHHRHNHSALIVRIVADHRRGTSSRAPTASRGHRAPQAPSSHR